jgi:hypothetical protein
MKSKCNHLLCGICGGLVSGIAFAGVTDVCSPSCLVASGEDCVCKCGGRYHKRGKLPKKYLSGIGALPVGLTGKLFGMPYEVTIQYDIEGKVVAQIWSESAFVSDILGDKKHDASEFDKVKNAVNRYYIAPDDKKRKNVDETIKKLINNLSTEVRDYNAGKPSAKPQYIPSKPIPKNIPARKVHKKKTHFTKYIDKDLKKDRVYEVKRDKKGKYKSIERIAGIKLKKFNINSLDAGEKRMYKDLTSKGLTKENAIEVLINMVEGDYTQLSKGLAKLAKQLESK